jgi:hypothetical protein
VRVLLAGLLIATAFGVMPLPSARAVPEACPPACDTIPAVAWPEPGSLPLDDTYHWPALAGLALPVNAPKFRFEELCGTPGRLDDPRVFAVAAKAQVGQPDGRWQLQAQIVHWRGETWRGGQLATSVFDTAVAALRACQSTAPQYSPLITTAEPNRLAAIISGPVVVHQYLLVDPRNSTISELVFTTTGGVKAPVPWPMVSDDEVLDTMAAPLCDAYLSSCG